MKQLTIKKKITLWYTGIIAVVLGTILVLVLLFVDKVGISATEEEISAAVTGFSSNINFQDDSFYLDGGWIILYSLTGDGDPSFSIRENTVPHTFFASSTGLAIVAELHKNWGLE